jgi:hypothetical protein
VYAAVHAALAEALRGLGVPIDSEPRPSPAHEVVAPLPVDVEECFVRPAPGEITAAGRKLVGSAQWRNRGAILQHGSILVRNDQHLATVSGEGGAGAIGLEDVCEAVPTIRALAGALVDAVAALTRGPVTRRDPSAAPMAPRAARSRATARSCSATLPSCRRSTRS